MQDITTTANPLGKHTDYIQTYTPSLLFPIPRQLKRDELGIQGTLPFHGTDIWNAFEVSWLNVKGKPRVAIAEFYIPADSTHIVESKSFKLYLNSFNQHRFDSQADVTAALTKDISEATDSTVSVKLISPKDFHQAKLEVFEATTLDELDIIVDDYLTQTKYLTTHDKNVTETLCSDLLKSNCLVTNQPDWGSVLIKYSGNQIDKEGLLKYIISFRNHNEFHEQCVERIFMDIMTHCQPKKLTVYARYTRRGGLDINPFRSNFEGTYANMRLARQ